MTTNILSLLLMCAGPALAEQPQASAKGQLQAWVSQSNPDQGSVAAAAKPPVDYTNCQSFVFAKTGMCVPKSSAPSSPDVARIRFGLTKAQPAASRPAGTPRG